MKGSPGWTWSPLLESRHSDATIRFSTAAAAAVWVSSGTILNKEAKDTHTHTRTCAYRQFFRPLECLSSFVSKEGLKVGGRISVAD